jgi:anti-sigma F factor antagonist
MQLYFKLDNRTLIISIVGEIDHHTSEDIRDRIDSYIDANPVKNVIFDFSRVNFMDSAGIGVIIGRYKKITPLGGKVALVSPSSQIKRVLEISGVLRISKIFDTTDTALLSM